MAIVSTDQDSIFLNIHCFFSGGRISLLKENESINEKKAYGCHGAGKVEARLSLHSPCSKGHNFPAPAPSIPNTVPHPENPGASTKPGPGDKP